MARAMNCIRLANSASAGIVSFLIRSQHSDPGSPACGEHGRCVLRRQRDRFVLCVPGVDGGHVVEHAAGLKAWILELEEAELGQPGACDHLGRLYPGEQQHQCCYSPQACSTTRLYYAGRVVACLSKYSVGAKPSPSSGRNYEAA